MGKLLQVEETAKHQGSKKGRYGCIQDRHATNWLNDVHEIICPLQALFPHLQTRKPLKLKATLQSRHPTTWPHCFGTSYHHSVWGRRPATCAAVRHRESLPASCSHACSPRSRGSSDLVTDYTNWIVQVPACNRAEALSTTCWPD